MGWGLPSTQRIEFSVLDGDAGRMTLRFARQPQMNHDARFAGLVRGVLPDELLELSVVTDPELARGPAGKDGKDGAKGDTGAKGDAGAAATTLLGTLTITETATVAIAAGLRRVTVTTPAAWGVAVGQDILLCPTGLVAGYAVHNAIVTAANMLQVTLTVPLISIGVTYTIACRARRLA